MSKYRTVKAWRAVALVAMSACTACQSGAKVDEATRAMEAERIEAFGAELTASTEAINAGQLGEARGRLEAASELARSDDERAKVEALDRFLIGAEALLTGDVQLASREWAQIDDPALGSEIRDKAPLIGLTVPEASEGSEDE